MSYANLLRHYVDSTIRRVIVVQNDGLSFRKNSNFDLDMVMGIMATHYGILSVYQ